MIAKSSLTRRKADAAVWGTVTAALLALWWVGANVRHSSPTAAARKHALTGNVRNDQLLALDESGQASMLQEIPTIECKVSEPFYMGPVNASFDAFWSYRCGKRYYALKLVDSQDEEEDREMDCDVLLTTANVYCFKTFSQQQKERDQRKAGR